MSYKPQPGDTGTFYPAHYPADGGFSMNKPPAVRSKITRAWSDTCVNLECENGVLPTSVLLVNPAATPPGLHGYFFIPDALTITPNCELMESFTLPVGAVVHVEGRPFRHLGGGKLAGHQAPRLIEGLVAEGEEMAAYAISEYRDVVPVNYRGIALVQQIPAEPADAPTGHTYTFAEFVQYGLEHGGTPVTNGMPWSFQFHGYPVTHENDDLYIIADGSQNGLRFARGRLLAWDGKDRLAVEDYKASPLMPRTRAG